MTKEQRMSRLLASLGDSVTGPADILADQKPSALFWPVVTLMRGFLRCNPERKTSKIGMALRRLIHPAFMLLVPAFMEYRQVIESRNALWGMDAPDEKLNLTDGPVIWCANHGFRDDIAATIRSTRQSYVYFGSLPHFCNSLDGLALFVNGVILCNRKVRRARQASYAQAVRILKQGNNLTIWPEGVWNKTPDKLMLPLWPGIYRMASESGSKVVPVIHYLADPHKKYEGNVIHTVIAEPVSVEGLSEQEGLEAIRDAMATGYFLLMEKYGRTTREELMDSFASADEAWESAMAEHTGCVAYYDREIELCADYRPKQIDRPEDVWQSVAGIEHIHAGNAAHVRYARELVARERRRDFQRRF